ncbi:MAG TPA: bifunctional enoyl-CoA hydratase/phosphate acetyltransferase [Noviherbaspirillum sp.]|uniref:bifunctional enoyl-CoA hydratase/phosphate acetyltransferase n=1 Tax=Noviherbaspirillum sp. TaxID=1926288 RepID=UPI002B4697D4|nr:bifunctional enoyl-CoA hydratase/phosphate acetyltransferase [Noviherbaspirillum sp.]HJV88625.1 bifunctional enoyl-CoA hydratase/phosphate acetyltransferase [Noviherbaspirillum sp.]
MNDIISKDIENTTYDELTVGQSARLVRTLSLSDIQAFAAVSGDYNPTHVDAEFAVKTLFHGVVAHSMWGATLISSLLGTQFPGAGTVYVDQSLHFMLPVRVGDTLTVVVTVTAKDDLTKRVTLDCRVANQTGKTVLAGTAVVLAPTRKVSRHAMPMPWVHTFDPQARLDALLSSVRHLAPVRCAVVHPCDPESLRGALDAARHGLIEPVLIAPEAKLRAVADATELDLGGIEIRPVEHSVAAAERAAEMAANGEVEALMKGSLHTDELMHAVVTTRALRTKRRLSHVFRFDVPMYEKPLLISDAALNIKPSLEEKVDIIQNAINLSHALGNTRPNVAILSAVETVNIKMQSTLDAAALCKMADRGQITGGNLDGPLAFDNAVSMEAVRIKGIESTVAGNADILIVPDLESGNMLAKQLEYLAGATTCGVVLGARIPIALTSRADGANARVASAALAMMLAHHNRKVQP